MEAEVIAKKAFIKPNWHTALFGIDFSERRVHQKAFFYGFPACLFIKFIYMFIVRRAFLDGWPGIRYAVLQAIYKYFVVLKTKEIHQSTKLK